VPGGDASLTLIIREPELRELDQLRSTPHRARAGTHCAGFSTGSVFEITGRWTNRELIMKQLKGTTLLLLLSVFPSCAGSNKEHQPKLRIHVATLPGLGDFHQPA